MFKAIRDFFREVRPYGGLTRKQFYDQIYDKKNWKTGSHDPVEADD
jgi:hypothetical protein